MSKAIKVLEGLSITGDSELSVFVSWPGGRGFMDLQGLSATGSAFLRIAFLQGDGWFSSNPSEYVGVSDFTSSGAYSFDIPACEMKFYMRAEGTDVLNASSLLVVHV